MKKAILIFTAVIFISCNETESNRVQSESVEKGFGTGISIITVDSCQYVFVKRGYGAGLSHKGNCNNPIHKTKP